MRPGVFVATLLLAAPGVNAQQCAGSQVVTQDAHLYGRFETRMQSVAGDGVVSSFFLYNIDLGCNWPAENNEIDIEMTGNRSESVQFTTHYPGPSSYTQIVPFAFNPHTGMHDYAFEWEPGIVRWFVDGALAYTQDTPVVHGLIHPMRILMNLYAADAPTWVGDWDPSVMPAASIYDYVRYYAYTPGSGDAGTGNNFTLAWGDDFDTFDTGRWETTEFGGFGGNFCTFVEPNVEVVGGELRLAITEPLAETTSSVSFRVDVSALALQPGDTIYLNGTFNGWCGSCNPMADADGDDTWELTISLPAGKHEFLFTKNVWDELGGAPLGSSCDALPCDKYANYGVTVPYGVDTVDTETYCWGTCESCAFADIDNDLVADTNDNCASVSNPAQTDTDDDGIGNACDADLDNDCFVGFQDLQIFSAQFGSTGDLPADLDADGFVGFADLGLFGEHFGTPPGPSGLPNACAGN